jgi:hypothetical protein
MRVCFLFLVLWISTPLFAAETPAAKKKTNTQVYSHEESSVSGKVKLVREIQEETEVFLEGSKGGGGPFVLPVNTKNRARILKLLEKSQKPGGPEVTLSIDDQQRIKNVEESGDSNDKSNSP